MIQLHSHETVVAKHSKKFLVIREGYHMLIFFLSLGASLPWAISNRELITINFCLTSFLESSLLLEQCVADTVQIASAMGLKVKKWLTNSQFNTRRILIFLNKSIKRFNSLTC